MHVPVSLSFSLYLHLQKRFGSRSDPNGIQERMFPGLSITRFWGRNSTPFLMPKSMFFSQFQTKNSQFEKKKKIVFVFFVLFSIFISYNTNTEHIVLHYISRKKVSLIIGINLAMETSYIRTMSNFPILVKTPRIFPIQWAPAPFPKRGVRALVS